MLPAYKSHGLNTIARVNDGQSTGAVGSAAVPISIGGYLQQQVAV